MRWYRFGIISGILLGLVLIGAIVWHVLQQPAVGSITSKKATALSPAPAATASYKQLKGQTFSLEYPSTFHLQPMPIKSNYSGIDNNILATSNAVGNDQLAIAVAPSQGPLESNSAFHYRRLYPNLYTESDRRLGSDSLYVFTKTAGGYEQTAFIIHANLVATVALTSTDADPTGNAAIMDHALQTFHWLTP